MKPRSLFKLTASIALEIELSVDQGFQPLACRIIAIEFASFFIPLAFLKLLPGIPPTERVAVVVVRGGSQ